MQDLGDLFKKSRETDSPFSAQPSDLNPLFTSRFSLTPAADRKTKITVQPQAPVDTSLIRLLLLENGHYKDDKGYSQVIMQVMLKPSPELKKVIEILKGFEVELIAALKSAPFIGLVSDIAKQSIVVASQARLVRGSAEFSAELEEDFSANVNLINEDLRGGLFDRALIGNKDVEEWIRIQTGNLAQKIITEFPKLPTKEICQILGCVLSVYQYLVLKEINRTFQEATGEFLPGANAASISIGAYAVAFTRIQKSFIGALIFELQQNGLDLKALNYGLSTAASRTLVKSYLTGNFAEEWFQGLVMHRELLKSCKLIIDSLIEHQQASLNLPLLLSDLSDLANLSVAQQLILAPGLVLYLEPASEATNWRYCVTDGGLGYAALGISTSAVGARNPNTFPFTAPDILVNSWFATIELQALTCAVRTNEGSWVANPRDLAFVSTISQAQKREAFNYQSLEPLLSYQAAKIQALWERYSALFGGLPDIGPLIFIRDPKEGLLLLVHREKSEEVLGLIENYGTLPTFNPPLTYSFEYQTIRLEDPKPHEIKVQPLVIPHEPIPIALTDHQRLQNIIRERGLRITDVINVLERLGATHDYSAGKGSHSKLTINERLYPLSKLFRDSTSITNAASVRRILEALDISLSSFISKI